MKRLLASLLLCSHSVLAAVYYVEPAPVAPYSCTATQPCRVQDLPTAFSPSDSVIFLPATTGTSSTYASISKTFAKPSVTLSAGTTFSACAIQVQHSNSLTCVGTVNLIAGSSLATATVATVSADGCNFDNSQFIVQGASAATFKNAAVTALSSTRRIQLQASTVNVDTVAFSSGTVGAPVLSLITGNSDSTFSLNAISMNGMTTTGANSLILVQSTNGKEIQSSGAQSPSFTNCVSGSALIEMRVNGGGGQTAFTCDFGIASLTATGGSVVKGIYYFNNNNNNGAISASVELTTVTGVNLGGGNAINLNANSGVVGVDGWSTGANSFCFDNNVLNLIACTGTQANANIRLQGDTNGPTTISGCGVTTMANMGNSC